MEVLLCDKLIYTCILLLFTLYQFFNLEFSLYIKGIVNGMNKSALDKVFRTFGTVMNLDVVPTKVIMENVEFG